MVKVLNIFAVCLNAIDLPNGFFRVVWYKQQQQQHNRNSKFHMICHKYSKVCFLPVTKLPTNQAEISMRWLTDSMRQLVAIALPIKIEHLSSATWLITLHVSAQKSNKSKSPISRKHTKAYGQTVDVDPNQPHSLWLSTHGVCYCCACRPSPRYKSIKLYTNYERIMMITKRLCVSVQMHYQANMHTKYHGCHRFWSSSLG